MSKHETKKAARSCNPEGAIIAAASNAWDNELIGRKRIVTSKSTQMGTVTPIARARGYKGHKNSSKTSRVHKAPLLNPLLNQRISSRSSDIEVYLEQHPEHAHNLKKGT